MKLVKTFVIGARKFYIKFLRFGCLTKIYLLFKHILKIVCEPPVMTQIITIHDIPISSTWCPTFICSWVIQNGLLETESPLLLQRKLLFSVLEYLHA